MIYAVFDLIFLPQFFKTAYKAGKAFLLAVIPATLLVVAMEAAAHIPSLAWLDSVAPADLLRQLPLLLIGAVVYAAAIIAAYHSSARSFESVDL